MPAFLSWMLFASAVGFLKVMALARLLPPASFGNYGSVVGVALLSSTVLSFGRVEGTIKLYPRLWINGEQASIRRHASAAAVTMAARFAIATTAVVLIAAIFDLRFPALAYLAGGVLGLGNSILALVASLIRATGSAPLLQRFSAVRAFVAILLSCGLGIAFGWIGAVAGDATATLVTLGLTLGALRREFPSAAAAIPLDQGGGKKIYLSTLLSSSTSLADRAFVNLSIGPAAAGTYGIISLMVQIGQLTVTIVAQRLGPVMIKAFHNSESTGSGLRLLLWPTAGLLVLAASLVCAMLTSQAIDFPSGFLSAYGIGPTDILLGGALIFMQIFTLVEFLLIARDRESSILSASTLAAAIFFSLFGLVGALHLHVEAFIASAVAARLVQVATLVWLARRRSGQIRDVA